MGQKGLLALLLFVAYASVVSARPPGDPASRRVGIVDQPCAPQMNSPDMEKTARDQREHLLDPNERREIEPTEPVPARAAARHTAEDDPLHNDWAQLCRYRSENAAIHKATAGRVVFLGDSITELWMVLGSVPPAGMFPWRPSVPDAAQHIVELNDWLRGMRARRISSMWIITSGSLMSGMP